MTDDDWDFSRPAARRPPVPTTPQASLPSTGPVAFPPGVATPYGFADVGGSSPGGGTALSGHVGPPVSWLAAAALAAAVGLVISAVSMTGVVPYAVAWALAGPIAIGLLTVFLRRDAIRQTTVLYSYPTWKNLAYRAVLVLCLVAVVLAALRIADWFGHR